MGSIDGLPYVEARWFNAGRRGQSIDWIVMHVMVAPEKPTTAEAVARYFQRGERKASAHVCFDNDSGVRCVLDENTAYGASGANTRGFHIELAGYPDQTSAQWRDPFSDAMLSRAAIEAARVVKRKSVPLRPLMARDLQSGLRGFTTHAEVERAFPSSGHWDPGPHFPMGHFLDLVAARPLLPESTTPNGHVMIDCTDALICPVDGGFQKLQGDGGVFNDRGCTHFHGSYFTLAKEHRNANRHFRAIVRLAGTGYSIIAQDGAIYDFPAT